MIPLIDGDVLRYEVGAIGDIDIDTDGPKSFDFVAEVLDGKIADICRSVNAFTDPIIFLTGKTNFRNEVAITRPYKGTRKNAKPFHYDNITAYLHNQYEVRMQEGLEADDLMSIEQVRNGYHTIICTRDKDLRMVPGWHYGWECGAQRELGPVLVDEVGALSLDMGKKPPKLTGFGEIFFYSQLLTGDTVDNIPGCPGVGAVGAYHCLTEPSDKSLYERVRDMYYSKNLTDEYLLEQGRLLWMTRQLHPDGSPVLWSPPLSDTTTAM